MVSFAQYEAELRKVIHERRVTNVKCKTLLTDIYGIRDSVLDNNSMRRDENIARWTSECQLDMVTVVKRLSEKYRIRLEQIETIQKCSDILSTFRNMKPPTAQLFLEAKNMRQRAEELRQIKGIQEQDME